MNKSNANNFETFQSIGQRTNDIFESSVHSKLFDSAIPVCVYLQDELEELSRQQFASIKHFSDMEKGNDRIAEILFEHWQNNDSFGKFNYESPSEIIHHAQPSFLLVLPLSEWGEGVCMLMFKVEWDVEHGAGVFIVNGVPVEYGDVDSKPPKF